jgi:hypothetical protein
VAKKSRRTYQKLIEALKTQGYTDPWLVPKLVEVVDILGDLTLDELQTLF